MIIKECEGVYPPSEDSFFLLKIAKIELENLKIILNRPKVLEIGTGTGIVAINLAKQGAKVVATDISFKAVRCAELNAKLNGVMIDIRQGNLFEPIKSDEKFDLIIFNPPYLGSNEGLDVYIGGDLLLAVRGAMSPYKLIKEFLLYSMGHLSREGRIIIIVEDKIFRRLTEVFMALAAQVLEAKKLEFETLLAVRIFTR